MPEAEKSVKAMEMYAAAMEAKAEAKRLWKEFREYAERIESEEEATEE